MNPRFGMLGLAAVIAVLLLASYGTLTFSKMHDGANYLAGGLDNGAKINLFVYFFYGLAFYGLSLAVMLKYKKSSNLKLVGNLPLLAGFGITHAFHEWAYFLLLAVGGKMLPSEVFVVKFADIFLLAASYLFLFQFGAHLYLQLSEKSSKLVRLPAGFFVLWALSLIYLFLYGEAAFRKVEILARYLLGIPAALLSAYALILQSRNIASLKRPNIEGYFFKAGVLFALYAGLTGLVVEKAQYLPASIINYESFSNVLGLSAPAFRMVLAFGITIYIIRALEVFEIETQEHLETSVIERTAEIKLANEKLRLEIAERKRAMEALHESEERYRTLAEAAHDMIFIINREDRVHYVNSFAAKQFGRKPDEVIGKRLEDLFPLKISERQKQGLQKVFETGEPIYAETMIPFNDRAVWLGTWLVPLRDNKGEFSSVLGISRDVTERKRAEEALKNYAEQLEEANRRKDLFTDIMHHDLLNPAGVIRNFAEMQLENAKGSDQKEAALITKSNADKIIEVIQNANMYAKLDTMEKLEFERLELCEVFKGVMYNFTPLIEENNIKVEYHTQEECHVIASPMIEHVFSNLLSNAIKYSPKGGKIEVGVFDDQTSYRIYFKDWGDGIADEDKQKLFTRFQRADKRGVKGTGLGLAIVKRIVDLHNGRVWIEDNPEGGSIFYVSLNKG